MIIQKNLDSDMTDIVWDIPMVIIPPLFALYCFETLNPWKTSNRKLHNENTIKPRQWYNSQSLKYPYGCHNTLVCSLFFWNLPWARRYIYLQVILFFFSQLNGLTSFFSPTQFVYIITIKQTRNIPDRGENLFAADRIF